LTRPRGAPPSLSLRNAIIANNSHAGQSDRPNDRSFYLGQHPNGKCLVGYDRARWKRSRSALPTRKDASGAGERVGFDHELRRRQFARFEQVPLDPSGRFTISKKLRRWGRLEAYGLRAGLGDLIEIWNPHRMLADPDVPEYQKQDCRDEMEEKGLL
jgi:DNA-binding transcriptional regulator/RsmH inhibitor MraZ